MKISKLARVSLIAVTAASVALAPSAFAASTITGSGATSVGNIISNCKTYYATDTGDTFNYGLGGSGQGQKDMEAGKVDMAFSDSKHLTSQSGTAINSSEIHIPAFVWPIGIMVNLNYSKPIALSPKTLGGIFSGKITRWNDAAILADNNRTYTVTVYKKLNGQIVKDEKGNPVVLKTNQVTTRVTLPDQPITVIYRADGSGTTDNLRAALAVWDKDNWGTSTGNNFAATAAGKAAIAGNPIRFVGKSGSSSVALEASKTKYSITYAEVNYAAPVGLKVANIVNKNGDLVAPTDDSVAGFVSTAKLEANGTVTLDYLNPNAGVYPLTVVTYALALTNYGDTTKAAAVKKLIEYHAFTCPTKVANSGFITIPSASPLGKVIASQLAKLGK